VKLSAKVDYAVRAALELAAAADNGPVKSERIATAQDIPARFLENILTDLRHAGLVHSQRGADGGFWLARPPSEITVADVIRAEEGNLADIHGERPEQVQYPGASERLRDVWVAARAAYRQVLEGVTLEDIASGDLPDHVRELTDRPDTWESHWPPAKK
jgi:Rrf2 family protein